MNTAIRVSIHNQDGTETRTTIQTDDASMDNVSLLHDQASRQNPDAHVNFYWGESFILGMPYNQQQDEARLDRGEMTWVEYQAKWYPEVTQA